jgi:molybdopterin synthase sulfur carrier subunit
VTEQPVRVVLPAHGEVVLPVATAGGPSPALTIGDVLDAVETAYPMLRGTIRDQTGKRRAFVRFFACEQDLSHEPADAPLPDAVARGTEPLLVVGAMAGG